MSLYFILLLASVGGAVVFFGAGLLIGRIRSGALPEAAGAAREGAKPVADDSLAAVQAVAEHLSGELVRTRAETERVDKEVDRLRAQVVAQAQALEAAEADLIVAKAAAQTATRSLEAERTQQTARQARLEQLEKQRTEQDRQLERLRATEADLRAALERGQSAAADLDGRKDRIRELEAALEEIKVERTRWQEQQFELEQRLKGVDPEVEKTLRHDLVVVKELLRTQEEKAKRLDESNAELQRERDSLGARAARLEALERENQELKVRALASDLSPSAPRRSTNAIAGTHALHMLVSQVANLDSVRAAVIGDDLGLVVACQGSQPAVADELAAIGALFDRACGEARKVLPLDRIQRVIIEDEGKICVTVRPLETYDGGAGDDKLTLVTLAHGAEPDPGQVARILGQDPMRKTRPGIGQEPPPLARESKDANQLGT